MFGDLRYFGWMAQGIISTLSFTYYAQKYHAIETMKKTSSPAAYRTFWGFGEYMRVLTNMVVSLLLGITWVGTFIPVRMTHKLFGESTTMALAVHGLKYFGLILTKVASYATDSYKRDYYNTSGQFDQKMFVDGIDDAKQAIELIDQFMEMSLLGG